MEMLGRGLLSCSELRDGSPHMCRLKTTSVGPCGTTIDFVLMHTRFMGSANLVASMVTDLDISPFL
jgi:hypothetical protein